MKTYTKKSNATRAARKQFGQNAVEGKDYTLVVTAEGTYGFKAATTSGGGKPGVLNAIRDVLTKAGNAEKAVTANDILKALAKKFPDRSPEAMGNTLRFALGTKGVGAERVKEQGSVKRYYLPS